MKKTMTAILFLSLCAALLLSACSKPVPAGSWTAEIRYADYASQLDALSPGLSGELDLSGLKLELKLDLSEDGSFNLYTEQASLDRLMADLRGPVKEAARQSMLETYGITQAQLEERLTELGLTMDQMTDQFFGELKDLEKPVRITGAWRWEDGSLFLTAEGAEEASYRCELTEESLTIQSAADADAVGFNGLLPLGFRK